MILYTGLDVQHQTLVTETGLFRHRLAALRGIVAALMTDSGSHQLGRQTCEAELKVLEHRLNKLAQNVAKEGSLNAGGKFEWIDSVLVKVSNVLERKLLSLITSTIKAFRHSTGAYYIVTSDTSVTCLWHVATNNAGSQT
jgi:hypothetical protein